MINPDSIKAKLKNQAQQRGRMLQENLTTYGLERTLYRISITILMLCCEKNQGLNNKIKIIPNQPVF